VAKFDLNDERDHLAIQTRLDWIGSPLRIHELEWVWDSVVRRFEEDCGLPKRFISVINFPTFLPGHYGLTVHDLLYRLSIENNQPTGDTRGSKLDLNDKRDRLIIQAQLDWIFSPARVCEPVWVLEAAVRRFEKDCGLPEGFISEKKLPTSSQGEYKVTIYDLWCQLENSEKE